MALSAYGMEQQQHQASRAVGDHVPPKAYVDSCHNTFGAAVPLTLRQLDVLRCTRKNYLWVEISNLYSIKKLPLGAVVLYVLCMPLAPCWAITMHKSPGQTVDKAVIDRGNPRPRGADIRVPQPRQAISRPPGGAHAL